MMSFTTVTGSLGGVIRDGEAGGVCGRLCAIERGISKSGPARTYQVFFNSLYSVNGWLIRECSKEDDSFLTKGLVSVSVTLIHLINLVCSVALACIAFPFAASIVLLDVAVRTNLREHPYVQIVFLPIFSISFSFETLFTIAVEYPIASAFEYACPRNQEPIPPEIANLFDH
jgi:hypothetical protein